MPPGIFRALSSLHWNGDPVRTTALRGLRGATIVATIALSAGMVAPGAASGANDAPTAVASKKKCDGPLWKCAPKRYHLSATDTVGPGSQSAGFVENWTAEVDLVRLRRNFAKVIYGTEDGTVSVSGSFPTVCEDSSPATIRIEPQKIPVPRGPGYPFLGDFGVEFTLVKTSSFKKNTYGGPLGTQGSGNSSLLATAVDPCPNGQGTFQTQLSTPRAGMEGSGKVGNTVTGSGVFNTIFQRHSFSWKLTPKK
jgi:hypothetical protein